MTEQDKPVHIYQAQCDAPSLGNGVEFQMKDRIDRLEGESEAIHAIQMKLADVTLYLVQELDDQRGYVVRFEHPKHGNYHFNIERIDSNDKQKFRVVYPEHFKDLDLPWERS